MHRAAPWKELVGVCKYQIYKSHSHNPFTNLSIEHYLLQHSPPYSTILFLYRNSPCVVIGRNQNPWLEVNFNALWRPSSPTIALGKLNESPEAESPQRGALFVRRRSGGGAVYHDLDNLNFSVICPPADFTRDKYAEMVTEAIRDVNLRARVNERHDIVLDQGKLLEEGKWPHPMDMHATRYETLGDTGPPLKVSGSAYKLTRQRALHHGTCLLTSRDPSRISLCLNSPARPFIKARGVDSVRSPVGKVYNNSGGSSCQGLAFEYKVAQAFAKLHGIKSKLFPSSEDGCSVVQENDVATGFVGHPDWKVDEISEGVNELTVGSSRRSVSTLTRYPS